MSVECGIDDGRFIIESDFYRVGFEAGDDKFCGAMEYCVKQGENENKVTDTTPLWRPFSLQLEDVSLNTYGMRHSLSAQESGPVRCVLESAGGSVKAYSIQSDTFDSFSVDERIVGYRDRLLIQHVWRNNSETAVPVFSNMHTWWYANGFYWQNSMVKNVGLRSIYEFSGYNIAVCLASWNGFGGPPAIADQGTDGWMAHWRRDPNLPAPANSDGNFVQTIVVFNQPPLAQSGQVIIGKIYDYHHPAAPVMACGTSNSASVGDYNNDGFNEGEGGYHFNCVLNRVEFLIDCMRGQTFEIPFYFPTFIVHNYRKATAPVLRLNGEFVDGEDGTAHDGAVHHGTSYDSAVIHGNKAVVWCNGSFLYDLDVQIADSIPRRKLLRIGANLKA